MKLIFPHSVFLSGALIAIFTAFPIFAESENPVQESALFVPWSAVENAVMKTVSDRSGILLNVQLQNVSIETKDIPVTVSQIQIDVKGQVKQGTVADSWTVDPLSISIAVDAFEISKIVERWVSGALVRVHLKAQCSAFDLNLNQGRAAMVIDWNSQGRELKAEVQNLDLSWPNHAWSLGEIKCDGPEGFADVISMELKKQLAEPHAWAARIKEELQIRLNAKLDESLKSWQAPTAVSAGSAGKIYIHFTSVDSSSHKGTVFKGFASTQKDPGFHPVVKPIDAIDLVERVETNVPVLFISGHEVARLSSEVGEKAKVEYELTKIAAFSRLLNSRFAQFFTWPDLMNFSKTGLFPTTSRFLSKPKVEFVNNRFKIQGDVYSRVRSSRGGRSFTYLDVRTLFSGEVITAIENEKLQLSWFSRTMNTNAVMNQGYVNVFNPRKSLPLSTVNEAMKNSSLLNALEFQIPRVKFSEELEYGAHKLHRVTPEIQAIELRLK